METGELDKVEEYEINIEEPRDKTNGDYSTNIAMLLTRTLRKPPRVIADAIVKNIEIGVLFYMKILLLMILIMY